MRQTLKRLTKMTAGYGLVQWAGPFISLILTPIITRILTPADYGVADFLLTTSSAIATVSTLALPMALSAHYNDSPEPAWKRRVVGSALTAALPLAMGVGLALAVFAKPLLQVLMGQSTYAPLLQAIGLSFGFGAGASLFTTAAQADLRVRWGMLFSVNTIACTVIGNVLFIVVLRLGVTGMILTPILIGVSTCLLGIVLTRSLVGRPSHDTVALLLRSGAILLPTVIASWMLQVVDRFFLVRYVSITELGYYSMANKIASLLGVAMAPVYGAWSPMALAMQRESGAQQQLTAMARYLVAAALAGSLALGLFSTEILIVLTRPAYLPAAPYVGLLTYIHVFSAINTTLFISGMIDKRLKAISGAVVGGAIFNLALNFALIPRYGIWGASIATAIGYGTPIVLLYWRIRDRLPSNYPVRQIVLAMAAELAILGLGLLIPPIKFPLRVGLKIAVSCLLPLAFIGVGLVTRLELEQGRLFVINQFNRWRRASHKIT